MSNTKSLIIPMKTTGGSSGALDSTGVIVTWCPNAEAKLESIKAAFDTIGMGHRAPRPRTLKEAVRSALTEKFSKKNRRIAPAGRGYELLVETPHESEVRIDTAHVVSMWVEAHDNEEVVVTDTPTFKVDDVTYTLDDVAAWVEAAKQRVDSGAVGEALAAVAGELKGITIRDSGGAYWLPPGSEGRWSSLVAALDKAGQPMRMRVWDAAASPRTIQSTIDAIDSMVAKKCEEVVKAISEGDLGVRAIETKSAEVATLAEQLVEYEEALNVGLDALRQKVAQAQVVAVQAGMVAMSEAEQKLRDRRMAKAQQEADEIA